MIPANVIAAGATAVYVLYLSVDTGRKSLASVLYIFTREKIPPGHRPYVPQLLFINPDQS
jgi:hypothetical protein